MVCLDQCRKKKQRSRVFIIENKQIVIEFSIELRVILIVRDKADRGCES